MGFVLCTDPAVVRAPLIHFGLGIAQLGPILFVFQGSLVKLVVTPVSIGEIAVFGASLSNMNSSFLLENSSRYNL